MIQRWSFQESKLFQYHLGRWVGTMLARREASQATSHRDCLDEAVEGADINQGFINISRFVGILSFSVFF